MSNETINLNEAMGNQPPRRNAITIDLTAGKGAVITNEQQAAPKAVATPIMTGPVNADNLRSIDPNTILPKREAEVNPMEAQMMSDLDLAVDREMNRISEFHEEIAALQEKERQEMIDAKDDEEMFGTAPAATAVAPEDYDDDLDDEEEYEPNVHSSFIGGNNRFGIDMEDDGKFESSNHTEVQPKVIEEMIEHQATAPVAEEVEAPVPVVKTVNNNNVNILDGMSDEELFADDEEEAATSVSSQPVENPDEPTDDELLASLRDQIREKVTPIAKSLDLSKFTINAKAISSQKVMKLAVENHMHTADWVMPSAGRAVSMSGLSGPEIIKLNPDNSNRNRQNTFRDMYRIIYDHIIDGNKPDFEVWLKTTRFVDLQHIYFTLYMATFGGSNFISYSCPKCKKVFLKDVEFKDMVIYADDETKKKIAMMLKQDTTTRNADTYQTELVQVSNTYALTIRTPSIWNVIMETASLSDAFLEKYSDMIDLVAYVDAAYLIDMNKQELIPVDTRPVPNDMAKTAGRRIKIMHQIISTLTSEEYYALRAKVNQYDEFASTKLSYKIPGCNCKYCNEAIPDNTEITPDVLLFTRHQLAAIGNMSN